MIAARIFEGYGGEDPVRYVCFSAILWLSSVFFFALATTCAIPRDGCWRDSECIGGALLAFLALPEGPAECPQSFCRDRALAAISPYCCLPLVISAVVYLLALPHWLGVRHFCALPVSRFWWRPHSC